MSVEKVELFETGRLSDELETLIDIGKALTSHLSIEDVYRVVMEKVLNLRDFQLPRPTLLTRR